MFTMLDMFKSYIILYCTVYLSWKQFWCFFVSDISFWQFAEFNMVDFEDTSILFNI